VANATSSLVLVCLVLGTACRHRDPGLAPAKEPCPGPREAVRVRVLDSAELGEDDPIAFRREPMLSFVVSLAVVEVIAGDFPSKRLGVLVHSPSVFAGEVWGYGASPQQHAAELELHWAPKYCMFELTRTKPPAPPARPPGAPFEFTAPRVHATILGP
jgi:hypothetical protein